MASYLISSSHHIDFDSVFGIDDTGLVQMLETLIATGLKEFLGCPAVFYEAALTEFFENSSVRDGVVVSTIRGTAIEISENFSKRWSGGQHHQGTAIEISQNIFSTTFGLPVDGLTDLSEVPKNLVSDAQSLFSNSKEQVSIYCLKKEMKIQYRLMSDILAKTLYVKAGSFDAVTRDRFMLMTAITFDVKVNWSSLLFGVLQDMVTPGSRQAKGFAIQICVFLKNVPGLVLGESRAFPASRVLTEKTVHMYVTINEKVGMEETEDAPRVNKTPAKKTVSTKRPVGDGEEAPIVKKKRTTKGQPPAPKIKSQKRKRRPILEGDDEIFDSAPEQPAAEAATDIQEPVVENEHAVTTVDSVTVETVVEKVDQSVPEPAVEHENAKVAETADDSVHDAIVFEPVSEQPAVAPVVEDTTDDTDAIIEQVLDQLDSVTTTDSGDQPVGTDAETIPWFVLPFVLATRDFERLFETANDSEDDMDADVDIAATLPSLSALSTDLSASFDDLQISLSARLDESQCDILSKLHTIEKVLRDSLQQQEEAFRTLIQGARQEGRTIDDVQTLRFNEFRKGVMANSASVTADLMDIKKAVRELNAKVDAVSTRLDELKKDVEATKEDISHQLDGNDKKGKVASEDLNHHLIIKTDKVAMQVVILLEALWKDLLVLIEKEKGAEGTEVDPTKEEDTRIEQLLSPCTNLLSGRLLFGVLQDMFTLGSMQAKGFAIQICVLLKNVPGLVLGESRAFPESRVLTEKTVHMYVTINEKVGMEETADAPRVNKTPVKKTVTTKRPVGDGEEAPIVNKKRTTKDAPTEQPPAPKIKSQKRKRRPILEGDDEIFDSAPEQPAAEAATDIQEPVVENEHAVTTVDSVTVETVVEKVDQSVTEPAVEHENAKVAETADDSVHDAIVFEPVAEQPAVAPVVEDTTDDPDAIIAQVLDQLDSVTTTDSGDQPVGTDAETIPWFVLPFVLATHDSERLFETANDSEDDMDRWRPRDRGAVISRNNTNTPSKCWIRTMILIDGVWVVEPCADHWVKLPRPVVQNKMNRQRSYDDILPPVSEFFKLMKKRWDGVCLEAVEFVGSTRLLWSDQ
ncbi:hypothetical protein F511_34522 [Dorcoceras hygrometricum]|uniref:Dystroglycan-like n=1 Tax=Dorcoceras hygrometricum TaxID=472368 RepID=A0A2Z7BMJ4_9LAMI|nr:hypothetical protein F511_34522 [Dorcoceras hygrometricum]